MNHYLMTCPSQTQAMKASRMLTGAGIWNAVVKPPSNLLINSCTHGVKIRSKDLQNSLHLLHRAGWNPITIYTAFSNGDYAPYQEAGEQP